jgi:transposase, IS5 family
MSSASRSRSPHRCGYRRGQFVAQAAALPGNPYDGHALAKVIPAISQLIHVPLKGMVLHADYRGHNPPSLPGLRVYTPDRSVV